MYAIVINTNLPIIGFLLTNMNIGKLYHNSTLGHTINSKIEFNMHTKRLENVKEDVVCNEIPLLQTIVSKIQPRIIYQIYIPVYLHTTDNLSCTHQSHHQGYRYHKSANELGNLDIIKCCIVS